MQIERDGDDLGTGFPRLVPNREAWLWKNAAAKGMVDRGLQQARQIDIGDQPDLAVALAFADSLPEE